MNIREEIAKLEGKRFLLYLEQDKEHKINVFQRRREQIEHINKLIKELQEKLNGSR